MPMEQMQLIEQTGTAIREAQRDFSPGISTNAKSTGSRPFFLEFFAGSGLVAQGLKGYFRTVWANDICDKKAAVYVANHGSKHFHLGSISDVSGETLPRASLAWASFPC